MLQKQSLETVFVFTDGSCKGNPGPCGAGACLFFPNQEKIELHQPVAKGASILLGELVAIKMALEYVKTEVNKREIKQLSVLSDSKSAVGVVTLGWQNKSHTRVVAEVQQTRDFSKFWSSWQTLSGTWPNSLLYSIT